MTSSMPRRRYIDKKGKDKVKILLLDLDKRLKAYVKFTDGSKFGLCLCFCDYVKFTKGRKFGTNLTANELYSYNYLYC